VNRKETLIKKEGGNIQIAEKAVYKSVFLTVWHYILSAELIKTLLQSAFLMFFAHWVTNET